MRRPARIPAAAAALLLCASLAGSQSRAQPFDPAPHTPRLEGTRVVWSATPLLPPAWATTLPLGSKVPSEARVLWAAAARDSGLRRIARYQEGVAALALGDTLGADALLTEVSHVSGLWQWQALSLRTALRSARGKFGSADSLLESAPRDGWPDSERASWLGQRIRFRALLLDTTQSLTFAGQLVRAYPSLGPATQALAALEAAARERGDSLNADDQRAAIEVDLLAGRREAAERRLVGALSLADSSEASAVARRLAETRRLLKRFEAAQAAGDLAFARARTDADRAAALVEGARLHRDQGRIDSSLVIYDRAEAWAEGVHREAVAWESAREAEDAGRWADARVRFERVAALALRRSNDGAFRAGLMWFALGSPDSARVRWRDVTGEAAEFWRGVAARRLASHLRRGAARDSLSREADAALRSVATRPGYAFYRMAARDTLRLRGWRPDTIAAAPETSSPTLAIARVLVGLGATTETQTLLSRWNARDPRVVAEGVDLASPEAWLAAAEIAYASGSAPLGIALADRATRALEDSLPARAWAATAWAYPPAFETIVAERPDSLSPAQLWGVMRQESRFDPRARSRSDALGLMQLMLPTARDMAKLSRDPAPDADDLFDPRRSIRYGARYLSRLVKRFDGNWAVALSAYNAGPSTIPPFWRDLIAQGGDALFAEIASNADAQDYVRKITGNIAAYRELAPSRR